MSDLPSDTKGRYHLCEVCAVLVLSYQTGLLKCQSGTILVNNKLQRM
jgi:hypothetical protein